MGAVTFSSRNGQQRSYEHVAGERGDDRSGVDATLVELRCELANERAAHGEARRSAAEHLARAVRLADVVLRSEQHAHALRRAYALHRAAEERGVGATLVQLRCELANERVSHGQARRTAAEHRATAVGLADVVVQTERRAHQLQCALKERDDRITELGLRVADLNRELSAKLDAADEVDRLRVRDRRRARLAITWSLVAVAVCLIGVGAFISLWVITHGWPLAG